MSPRLRVLAVLPAGVMGGAERWLLDLLAATDRLDVRVLSLSDGPAVTALRARGVPVEVAETGRRAVDGLRPALRLRRLLRSAPVDVVLANGVKAAALALPVAAAVGVPSVWVKHDLSFDARLARPLGRLATRVVATDASLAVAVGRDDVALVLPPAPPPALPRAEARAALGLTDDALWVACIGRLVDYKAVDDAVRALASPDADGWRLAVVGEDDPAAPGTRAALEALVVELGLEDRVLFTGAVPAASRLVPGVDALAVLTRPAGTRNPGAEGFGISALEAAFAGVPVVSVAGSPPALRLGDTAGVVVPPKDPGAVAAALRLLADPAVRAARGSAARATVAGHPSAAACADALVRVCAEAAGRPGAGLEGPPVSVVVTVFQEEAGVPPLLARLLPQLRADDELVVVDGGSRDRTVALLHACPDPRLTVVVEPGAGISAGRNLGVRAARHPVVACTDAGCEPAPGWLEGLRSAFAEKGHAELVTGTYRVTSRSTWETALAAVGYPEPGEARRATPLVRGYGALLGRSYDATLPTGRSMAFTRDAWSAAGGFPEHLQTGEDVSYGQAIVATGRRAVLALDAEVDWAQRETLGANLRMYRGYGRGDGLTGHRLLVGRNLARAVAYPAGLALLAAGPVGRGLALAGAAAYLSLPARRATATPAALPLVPVMAALRDGAKALGCLEGLRARRR